MQFETSIIRLIGNLWSPQSSKSDDTCASHWSPRRNSLSPTSALSREDSSFPCDRTGYFGRSVRRILRTKEPERNLKHYPLCGRGQRDWFSSKRQTDRNTSSNRWYDDRRSNSWPSFCPTDDVQILDWRSFTVRIHGIPRTSVRVWTHVCAHASGRVWTNENRTSSHLRTTFMSAADGEDCDGATTLAATSGWSSPISSPDGEPCRGPCPGWSLDEASAATPRRSTGRRTRHRREERR